MAELDFSEIVTLICKEDPRYARQAYGFVREGLNFTIAELRKSEKNGAVRHLSATELLDGLRVFALEQFGPLAATVLKAWGVRDCADFGEIVFNLIDYRVFSKSDDDRREDFAAGYDFWDAFVKPFLPLRKQSVDFEKVASGDWPV